jgi:hypothetical protein
MRHVIGARRKDEGGSDACANPPDSFYFPIPVLRSLIVSQCATPSALSGLMGMISANGFRRISRIFCFFAGVSGVP